MRPVLTSMQQPRICGPIEWNSHVVVFSGTSKAMFSLLTNLCSVYWIHMPTPFSFRTYRDVKHHHRQLPSISIFYF